MTIEKLQAFFFWCMIINAGIYFVTVLAVCMLRDWICRLNARIFGLSEETIRGAVFTYVAAYKLIITVFNFVPWVVILIIR